MPAAWVGVLGWLRPMVEQSQPAKSTSSASDLLIKAWTCVWGDGQKVYLKTKEGNSRVLGLEVVLHLEGALGACPWPVAGLKPRLCWSYPSPSPLSLKWRQQLCLQCLADLLKEQRNWWTWKRMLRWPGSTWHVSSDIYSIPLLLPPPPRRRQVKLLGEGTESKISQSVLQRGPVPLQGRAGPFFPWTSSGCRVILAFPLNW